MKKSCDIMGIITQLGNPIQLRLKSGENKTKLSMILLDESGVQVLCCIWGPQQHKFESDIGSLVFLKNVKITPYGGFSFNANEDTQISSKVPEYLIPRAVNLKNWFNRNKFRNFPSLSETKDSTLTSKSP